MLLLPDVTTAFIDPFRAQKTLALNFFIHDPFTREAYSPRPAQRRQEGRGLPRRQRHRRHRVLRRRGGVLHLRLDPPRDQRATRRSTTSTRSRAGGTPAARSRAATAATRPPTRAATSRCRRSTTTPTCATRWCSNLIDVGFTVERAHHEVGTAGQAEINYKFSTLLHAGDQLQLFKYIVKNTAWHAGKTATFMPKPLFGDNGSGMHTHQSLWLSGEPLFYDETGYAGLSDTARWYIGGLLHHAPSLLAFTNPTVNSYRRLVPGFEAPVNLVYSQRNRSACTRIPVTGTQRQGQARRVPGARPVGQPVPRLLGDADGRPRRHQEQDRAAGADRQGPVRPAAGGVRQRHAGAGLAAGGARLARGRPRLPARGRRVHPRPDRDLGRLQARATRSTRSACARPRTSSRCTTTADRPHTTSDWPRAGTPSGGAGPRPARAVSSRTTATNRSMSASVVRQLTIAGRSATRPPYTVVPAKTRPSASSAAPSRAVEVVELVVGYAGRARPEAHDAQRHVGQPLQVGRRVDQRGQPLGQVEVALDHRPVARRARTRPASPRSAATGRGATTPARAARSRRRDRPGPGRYAAPGMPNAAPSRRRLADQREPALVRHVEPLVPVGGDRVGPLDARAPGGRCAATARRTARTRRRRAARRRTARRGRPASSIGSKSPALTSPALAMITAGARQLGQPALQRGEVDPARPRRGRTPRPRPGRGRASAAPCGRWGARSRRRAPASGAARRARRRRCRRRAARPTSASRRPATVKLANVALPTSAPPQPAGSPNSSRSQSSDDRLDLGARARDETRANAFWSSSAAVQSAASAAGVAPPVTKWKKRGPDDAVRGRRADAQQPLDRRGGAVALLRQRPAQLGQQRPRRRVDDRPVGQGRPGTARRRRAPAAGRGRRRRGPAADRSYDPPCQRGHAARDGQSGYRWLTRRRRVPDRTARGRSATPLITYRPGRSTRSVVHSPARARQAPGPRQRQPARPPDPHQHLARRRVQRHAARRRGDQRGTLHDGRLAGHLVQRPVAAAPHLGQVRQAGRGPAPPRPGPPRTAARPASAT